MNEFTKVTLSHEIKKAVYVHVHILYKKLLFVKGTRKSWMHDFQGRRFMSRHVFVYVTEDRFPVTQMVASSYGKILNLRTPTRGRRYPMIPTRNFSDTMKPSYPEHILHRCFHLVTSRLLQEQYYKRHSLFLVRKRSNFLIVLVKKLLPKNTYL